MRVNPPSDEERAKARANLDYIWQKEYKRRRIMLRCVIVMFAAIFAWAAFIIWHFNR
jgi:hypothetical protein